MGEEKNDNGIDLDLVRRELGIERAPQRQLSLTERLLPHCKGLVMGVLVGLILACKLWPDEIRHLSRFF